MHIILYIVNNKKTMLLNFDEYNLIESLTEKEAKFLYKTLIKDINEEEIFEANWKKWLLGGLGALGTAWGGYEIYKLIRMFKNAKNPQEKAEIAKAIKDKQREETGNELDNDKSKEIGDWLGNQIKDINWFKK
jgi:hypothetical protein